MDVQLQELIDKIKSDGVKASQKKAQEMEAEAQAKAKAIVDEAQRKADEMVRSAKAEIARLEKASEDAVKQASRNILLSFRDAITEELSRFIQQETAKAYSPDMLKTLIPDTVKAWSKNAGADNLAVLVSEKDLKTLGSGFGAALKTKVSGGLEVRSDKGVGAGFRIGVNGGQAYYDYSAESVADLFCAYLNPRVQKVMKEVASEAKASE